MDSLPVQVREQIILAGGCFWGMEDLLRKIPGVIETEVGYAGGNTPNPKYPSVKLGTTGHAESIQITFDSQILNRDELFDFFFRIHDPTTRNRQGNDVGSQYRSAIFCTNDAQKKSAEAAIERASKSGRWKNPVVTEILAATEFFKAEDYHQDYLEKNPGGYSCHFIRI